MFVSPQPFPDVGSAPQGDVDEHGLAPGSLHLFYFLGRMPSARKERSNRTHDCDKRDEIAQRNLWRRMRAVSFVFPRRCVAQADFFLIVEPCLIVWAHAGIMHPLHKAAFYGCLVGLIRLSLRTEEPSGQLRLRRNARPPAINHLLCLVPKNVSSALQCALVLFGEIRCLL